MTPLDRSRAALPTNIRKTLEESNLPIEVATAIADLCEMQPEGGVFISLEMLRFLHGADTLHGIWFGEAVGTSGRYWWRKELPPIPLPQETADGN